MMNSCKRFAKVVGFSLAIGVSLFGTLVKAEITPAQIQQFQQLTPAQQTQAVQAVQSLGGGQGVAQAVQQALGSGQGVVLQAPAPAPVVVVPPPAPVVSPPAAQAIVNEVKQSLDKPDLKVEAEANVVKPQLKQFGYDLFAGSATTFAPPMDIPVPSTYVIGPGDTVQIQLFGKESAQYSLVVTREGTLNFPGLGPINVAGSTFQQMQEDLSLRIQQQKIGVQASITMGPLRSIQIFVLGDVNRPGSFTVSSLATMTNAIFYSGGISPIGSLRNIQLKRNGRVVQRLDLYNLLLRGDTSSDSRLMPGDVIFVPPIGPVAGVSGEVRRPAIYELRGEQTIGEVLAMAGNLTALAYPKGSQVERINQKSERTIVDLDLTVAGDLKQPVMGGDVLRVYSILERMENIVLLSGHAQRPGAYQWSPGMRLTDIIKSVDDLLPKPDLEYVVIRRERMPDRNIEILETRLSAALADPGSAANLLLQARDQVLVFGLEEDRVSLLDPIILQLQHQARFLEPARVVNITGNVRYPGTYPLTAGMTLADLVRASLDIQVETDFKYAILVRDIDRASRFGSAGGESNIEVLTVRLDQALEGRDSAANLKLLPLDHLFIFELTQDRAKILEPVVVRLRNQARFLEPARVVSVNGNVRYPGSYPLTKGMTVSTLVRSALDLLPETDLGYALLVRQLDNGERITVPTVKLNEALSHPGGVADLPLAPGDRLVVFHIGGTRNEIVDPILAQLLQQATRTEPAQVVKISGKVRIQGSYPLSPGMRVSDLITAAGGYQESAYGLAAEITRFEVIEGGETRQTSHETVNLADLTSNGGAADLVLRAHDVVTVRPLPQWRDKWTVSIYGEVKFPGDYEIAAGENVADLIKRAGGINATGYARGAVFLREELRKKEQALMDDLRARLKADLSSISLQQMQQSSATGGSTEAISLAQGLLSQLETTKAVGRLVLQLDQILAGAKQLDVALQDGDRLYIPTIPQEVSVIGEVNYSTSHVYDARLDRNAYIARSGGMTYKADSRRIYVVKANGEVIAAKSFLGFTGQQEIAIGDSIVVPLDAERMQPLTLWSSISQIVYQIGVAAAAWKTIGVF